jgi:hypothetical protein
MACWKYGTIQLTCPCVKRYKPSPFLRVRFVTVVKWLMTIAKIALETPFPPAVAAFGHKDSFNVRDTGKRQRSLRC